MNPDSMTTLVEMLRVRADATGGDLAFTYLQDGEEPEAACTYEELDRRARRIAVALERAGAAGDRALLLFAPGLDFIAAFFGCLYAGRIAVPTAPPNPTRLAQAMPRLLSMIESAAPRWLLTTTAMAPIAQAVCASHPALAGLRVLATDTVPAEEDRWIDPGASPETLAFLQYTSGSTALPKGVMVSHGNIMHNVHVIAGRLGSARGTVVVSWLPMFHDMGLIGCVLHPMLRAATTYLMAPVAFLQRPLRWLQAISRHGAGISGGPNFAYDLCVQRTTPEQRAALDLRSWHTAFNGAEPVRARTVGEFTRAFAPHGFRPEAMSPAYGLAESTLLVSIRERESPLIASFETGELAAGKARSAVEADVPSRALVGCGAPNASDRLVIVDPDRLTPCASGQIGEIWLAGPSVAQGYWRLPEETGRIFGATLAGTGEGPFLRTGDLGFLHEDQVFIAGRIKDLIIIDGRNHYPQDIELTVERCHPAFRPGCSAAFSIDVDGAERLVVVAEANPHRVGDAEVTASADPTAGLLRAARRAVALEHDLDLADLFLCRLGTIPKTTSGKLQRQECRKAFLAGSLQRWQEPSTPPRTGAPPAKRPPPTTVEDEPHPIAPA